MKTLVWAVEGGSTISRYRTDTGNVTDTLGDGSRIVGTVDGWREHRDHLVLAEVRDHPGFAFGDICDAGLVDELIAGTTRPSASPPSRM
ncbi:hypothetical protein ACFYO2_08215 [Streptomyces sp. NPDC006602]|uniref:hypothetical protein n=1 Tax=Streptomyces sp. NPDC006602 TaxID=3364751 RepID=UPI0036AF6F39